MKVFVTKYALTQGILEKEGEISNTNSNMFLVLGGPYTDFFFREGRDWHRTLEGAKDRAREMQTLKIISLKKSLKKIEALEF
jgi:hypothetical protein